MQRRSALVAALALAVTAVLLPASVGAQLRQPDGAAIPAGNTLRTILNGAPLNENMDVIADASLVPEVFTPARRLTLSFIAEGAGYENAFGYYNLGDDITNPANRFVLFDCNVEPQRPFVTRQVDFCAERAAGRWRGGPIGFFIITPELVANPGNSRNPNCGVNDNLGFIYYSEPRLNREDPVNPYIHHLVYRSNTYANAFYFGFEDLYRGGDNDFEDLLVLVEGLLVGDAPDACNGQDDDCDGRTDEGADAVCESACGAGVRPCVGGQLRGCTAPEPANETCNNRDDDCDGQLDEGLTRACQNGCGMGVEVCVAGAWAGCTAPAPGVERCDNVDNDCDGTTDEGLTQACQNGCGVAGLSRCQGGSYAGCDAPPPVAEQCNGRDDDCDGRTDENLVQACQNGCGRGFERCVGGAFAGCDAPQPSPETCNGIDDDCDGNADEGLTRACQSCGEAGQERCVGGAFVSCSARQPTPEQCNGRDDDCDGRTDEDIVRDCTNACGPGSQTCTNGVFGACDAPLPQPEQCDGVDQDCDGNPDEGLVRACRTECGDGLQRCVLGEYTECDAPEPVDEICNGVDEDCDGAIDEQIEAPCQSACGIGTAVCVEGMLVDCTALTPRDETCNALDDDCDGMIDEGLMRECRTPCGEGMQACEAGRWTQCPAPQAVAEVCNGEDDDCDGITDEDVMCAGDAMCVDGVCAEPCRSLECPAGQQCQGGYCIPQPCAACRAFEVCEGNRCVDPCAAIQCGDDAYCRAGECTAGDCYAGGCETGRVCSGGACIADDCALQNCGALQGCRMGMCFATCLDVTCGSDERCLGGACVRDACAAVSCTGGQICREGQCIADPCAGVSCDAGRVCVGGPCVDDPCLTTRCPEETTCVTDRDGVADCVPGGAAEPEPDVDGGTPLPRVDGGTGGDIGGKSDGCRAAPGADPSGLGWLLLLVVPFVRRRRALAVAALLALVALVAGCTAATDVDDSDGGRVGDGGIIPGCLPVLETCNGIDDNCNGRIDDVEGLDRDPLNCGACGNACALDNARPTCLGGQCRVLRCLAGYTNEDGRAANGCEAVCTIEGDGVETCNQRDDDCDGVADEGFDLGGDVENCGLCGRSCLGPGVEEAACISGRCTISACAAGRINLDGLAENGCEYACAGDNAEETCNGEDDDCDGIADEDVVPDMACRSEGLCAGARAECQGEAGFVCSYPEGVGGALEARCDGQDEDCDGRVDEDFPGLGDPCDGPDEDLCVNGVIACSPDRTGVVCREVERGRERCDGADNDCDGEVDEGYDLQVDPLNCGSCGTDCNALNAQGSCEAGQCVIAGCRDGFIDLDGDGATGCEYPCVPGPGGVETCDGTDDDCDGRIDEGQVAPPEAACLAVGVCAGVTAVCQGAAGFVCPYPAEYRADAETRCDGLDNDCDGRTDEDFPGVGMLCDGDDADRCPGGITACTADGMGTRCTDDAASISELCDGADNDCDGQTDEGFDFDTDPQNCGACNTRCERPGAESDCMGGECVITACLPGFTDANGNALDGCEYPCDHAPAPETCNGADDDCDGVVDEGVVPPAGLACDGPGLCAGLRAVCRGAAGFECPYPEGYQARETRCDNLDNDCDGRIDEAADNAALVGKGQVCSAGRGVCLSQGVRACAPNGQALVCTAVAGQPRPGETCNGLDDDCDGRIDEAIARADEMVPVDVGARRVWVDRYEASRPDATAALPGFNTDRACSRPGVLPWANVDYDEATAACAARGKRLCTDVEWETACGAIYPYGNAYNAATCNTNTAAAVATGSLAGCRGPAGTADMSGNVAEWARCQNAVDCRVVRPLLGGSFGDRVEVIWRCDFRSNGAPQLATGTIGFRCCQDN
ncbi:MAG: SUMF1/EgtB/PvdO family nonheme iron enzyme [Myxococcales bacterium]|nr:SUMF1/EgtB/PvdO family nonheme iron enzyme [Myxococcales bacterium]